MIKYKITMQNGSIIEVIGDELKLDGNVVKIIWYDEDGVDLAIFLSRLADVYTIVGDIINEP